MATSTSSFKLTNSLVTSTYGFHNVLGRKVQVTKRTICDYRQDTTSRYFRTTSQNIPYFHKTLAVEDTFECKLCIFFFVSFYWGFLSIRFLGSYCTIKLLCVFNSHSVYHYALLRHHETT